MPAGKRPKKPNKPSTRGRAKTPAKGKPPKKKRAKPKYVLGKGLSAKQRKAAQSAFKLWDAIPEVVDPRNPGREFEQAYFDYHRFCLMHGLQVSRTHKGLLPVVKPLTATNKGIFQRSVNRATGQGPGRRGGRHHSDGPKSSHPSISPNRQPRHSIGFSEKRDQDP